MNKLQLIDADTLYYKPLAHPKMLIDGVLSDGLAILAGDSKIGKSWMVLWLCLQISRGEAVWGLPTRKTDVVYLALEDREWRVQQRMQELTDSPPENLRFGFSCGQLGAELEGQIEETLREFPSTGLIFIDTLQMVRDNASAKVNAYAQDYKDLSGLKKLADDHGIYRQRDFYLHLPRVTGYLSFFRCVAIVLGVAPLYEKEYRQPLSAECREACRKLDRFTAEITLVCREHLDTPEDVQRFLARMDKEMDAITAARSKIRNKQRGCADPAERVKLKKSCAACTAELSRLRKQKQTAYNMIEDNPKLKALLACEMDAWVENDPYLSPREKRVLRNQRPSQEDKTIIR